MPGQTRHHALVVASRFVPVLLALVATLGIAPTAKAQSVLQAAGHDLRAAGSDVWWLWTSPFHASARDWRDAGVVVGAAGLIATADPRIDRWIVRNPSAAIVRAVEPFREKKGIQPIDLGSGNLLIPVSGGLWVSGLATGNRALRDAGIGCATAQQSNSILRGAIYSLVQRERPGTANGRAYRIRFPGGEWDQHSFFGGHVANAMACATFANTRFNLGPAGKLLYVGAAGIGLGRMVDRRHWASDSFLGAAFGYAFGRTVALRQRERLARESGRADAAAGTRSTIADRALSGFYSGTTAEGAPTLGWRSDF